MTTAFSPIPDRAHPGRLPPRTFSLPLAVEELTTIVDLERIRPEWEALFASCPQATPFQSPDWLIPWIHHFSHDGIWVLIARRGHQLVGVAPLRLTPATHTTSRVVSFLGQGISDYGGVLVADGSGGEGVAQRLFQHLMERRERWDLCDLDQLPQTDVWANLPLPSELSEPHPTRTVCPFVPLETSPNDTPPHRFGPAIARNLRRLARHGHCAFEIADAKNLDEILDAFFRLHADQWHSHNLPGVLPDRRLRDFHREVAHGMLARGRLRLHALRLNGSIEAVHYGFVHGRRFYSYLSGFGPRLASFSPGTVMIGRAMNAAAQESILTFDFLRGGEPYKYRWGALDRWNVRRLIRRATE